MPSQICAAIAIDFFYIQSSDLQKLGFFGLNCVVNLGGVRVGDLLHLVVALFGVVFGDRFVFFELFDFVVSVFADIANADFSLLAHRFGLFCIFLALLYRHRREKQLYALAVERTVAT